MHGMEKKSKPKPAKKQSMEQVIAGLSPEDKAKLLQSLIK
jgi:cation transport ATPase